MVASGAVVRQHHDSRDGRRQQYLHPVLASHRRGLPAYLHRPTQPLLQRRTGLALPR